MSTHSVFRDDHAMASPPTRVSATASPLDADTQHLLERITELQLEQHKARERIDELTQSKLQFQQALTRLREEKKELTFHRGEHEKLQSRLLDLLEEKQREQDRLREQLEEFRVQAVSEIDSLKAERDAAISRRQSTPETGANTPWSEYQYAWMALAIGVGVLVLGIITVLIM